MRVGITDLVRLCVFVPLWLIPFFSSLPSPEWLGLIRRFPGHSLPQRFVRQLREFPECRPRPQ